MISQGTTSHQRKSWRYRTEIPQVFYLPRKKLLVPENNIFSQYTRVEKDNNSTETDTDYNRGCAVTVNNKIRNNHKSVSMSNYKTINNLNVYLLSEVHLFCVPSLYDGLLLYALYVISVLLNSMQILWYLFREKVIFFIFFLLKLIFCLMSRMDQKKNSK